MTDEELGREMFAKAFPDVPMRWTESDYAKFGAAARELLATPIARMSVEEIEAEMQATQKITALHCTYGASAVRDFAKSYAEVAHRLAQPVARVDEDAGAKRLCWEYLQAAGVKRWATADKSWNDQTDESRNGWRAVAAAKEAGDA